MSIRSVGLVITCLGLIHGVIAEGQALASPDPRAELIQKIQKLDQRFSNNRDLYELGLRSRLYKPDVDRLLDEHFERMNKACSEVDHTKSKCLPPLHSQGDSKFCYVYSAARIVSFELCEEVSAAYLGIQQSAFLKEDPHLTGWGFAHEAITMGSERGYCREKDLPSNVRDGKSFFEVAKAFESVPETALDQQAPCLRKPWMTSAFPTLSLFDLLDEDLKGHLNLVYSKAQIACKNLLKKDLKFDRCPSDPGERMNFINLRLKDRPLELSSGQRPGGTIDSRHSVTIVGRLWDSERSQCQFIIDDSDHYNGKALRKKVSQKDLANLLEDPTASCTVIKDNFKDGLD